MSSSTSTKTKDPVIHPIFEDVTGTWQYVVCDPVTSEAIIIDPVLDFESGTQKISTKTADSIIGLVQEKGYRVTYILETHAHADHLTSAAYLSARLGEVQNAKPLIGIGRHIRQVQEIFADRYGIVADEWENVFDALFTDGDMFGLGQLSVTALHLPGHTPDHMGYKIGGEI
jgi:glyoxylase-like metal-dependent hydrolase (beta-lactamase superfamily II)